MTASIEHFVLHYGLLILSVGGVIEITRVLWTTLLDARALEAQGVNGPTRLAVTTRQHQSAFLLAVFAVLLGVGGRVALANEYELDASLSITLIISCDTIALLLGLKEWMIRKRRDRLDAYAERDLASKRSIFSHRRVTDVVPGTVDGDKD